MPSVAALPLFLSSPLLPSFPMPHRLLSPYFNAVCDLSICSLPLTFVCWFDSSVNSISTSATVQFLFLPHCQRLLFIPYSLPIKCHPCRINSTCKYLTVISMLKCTSLYMLCLPQTSPTFHTTWLKAH